MDSWSQMSAANFLTTRWSMIMRAGGEDSSVAHTALNDLCRVYWQPLYAYVRRRGHAPPEAKDLTQAFFARLLEKNYVAAADEAKGRFRSFLLVALKRFLADEWGRQHAQKRGGFQAILSIDEQMAEMHLAGELACEQTPEQIFERQWALTLLEEVRMRLRDEYLGSGRAVLFEHLEGCLTKNETAMPYAQIAAMLKLTVPAIKMAVQRLRARYRELLQQEIAKTVDNPAEVQGEIRYLVSLFGS